MRPRHMLLLTGLAALPVLLALLLLGSGGLSAPAPGAASVPIGAPLGHVTLELVGGSKGLAATQCGTTHHYRVYPSQGAIQFGGAIVPPGRWSVTVKLKACYGGAFQSAGDAQARVATDGSYKGSFPIPIGGYYYARAELKLKRSGQQIGRSTKVYFAVR
jgi:hypothetical protein